MRKGFKYYLLILVVAVSTTVSIAWIGDGDQKLPKVCYASGELSTLINPSMNVIYDPKGTLLPLMAKFKECRAGADRVISIMHIGDSHMQAGFLTCSMRMNFQREFGNAGRGMITPFKIAGTNQPFDYQITSPNQWSIAKCIDKPGAPPVGLTGLDIQTTQSEFSLSITSDSEFCIIRTFHNSKAPLLHEPEALQSISCQQEDTPNSTTILLNNDVRSIDLYGYNVGEYNVGRYYGFSLENGHPGVLYHGIGVNGATFEHYNNRSLIASQSSQLTTDMIIISLGTNDAYAKNFNSEGTYEQVDTFIKNLKKCNPTAAILVTTPMGSCRKTYSRGRARYVNNSNIGSIAEVIIKACRQNNVAYWNAYSVCGEASTHLKWSKMGLFQKDMLHLTKSGYEFEAALFFDAFTQYYNSTI